VRSVACTETQEQTSETQKTDQVANPNEVHQSPCFGFQIYLEQQRITLESRDE